MNQRELSKVIFGGLLFCCTGAALAGGRLTLAFTPDPARVAGVSPEGCYAEPGEPRGFLAPPETGAVCHSGQFGPVPARAIAGDAEVEMPPPAEFISAPFPEGLELGSLTTIRVYYINEARATGCADPCTATLGYHLDEIRERGEVVPIAAGVAIENLAGNDRTYFRYQQQSGAFDIGTHSVAAASRLRIRLRLLPRISIENVPIALSKGTLLFGGDALVSNDVVVGAFGDAGITFELADQKGTFAEQVVAGALPATLLLPLLLAALRRRVRVLAAAVAFACGTPAWAGGSLALAFTPDPLRTVGVSHEGCYLEPGVAGGMLAPPAEGGTCHTGLVGGGYAPESLVAGVETYRIASFWSAPFEHGLDLAGPATARVYYTDEALGSTNLDGPQALHYWLYEASADRGLVEIAHGVAVEPLTNYGAYGAGGASEGTFDVGAYRLGPGSSLFLRLESRGYQDSSARLIFGGRSLFADVPLPNFGDAGITFALGDESKSFANLVVAGALPFALLVPLLVAALVRRRATACLLVLGSALSDPALAEQPFHQTWSPVLTIGFELRGAVSTAAPSRFALQFDLRSGWRSDRIESLSLPILQLGVDRDGVDTARLMGRNLLTDRARLNQAPDGQVSNGIHWGWWTAGGVAVAVAVLAGGGGDDDQPVSPPAPAEAESGGDSLCVFAADEEQCVEGP